MKKQTRNHNKLNSIQPTNIIKLIIYITILIITLTSCNPQIPEITKKATLPVVSSEETNKSDSKTMTLESDEIDNTEEQIITETSEESTDAEQDKLDKETSELITTQVEAPINFPYQDKLLPGEEVFGFTKHIIAMNTDNGISFFQNSKNFLYSQVVPNLDVFNAKGIQVFSIDHKDYLIDEVKEHLQLNFVEYEVDQTRYLSEFSLYGDFGRTMNIEGRVKDVIRVEGVNKLLLIEELSSTEYKFTSLDIFFNRYNESIIELEEGYEYSRIESNNDILSVIVKNKEGKKTIQIFTKEDNEIVNNREGQNHEASTSVYNGVEANILQTMINDKYYTNSSNYEPYANFRDVVLYGTPYFHYKSDNKDIKIIDYRIVDNKEYMIEYETNLLYMVENNQSYQVHDEPILRFDIINNSLVFTSTVKEGLYVISLDDKLETQITNSTCDYIKAKDGVVFYLDKTNNTFSKYLLSTNKVSKLKQNELMTKVTYLNNSILIQTAKYFVVVDSENLEIMDTIYGYIQVVSEEKNQFTYRDHEMIAKYDINTKERVIQGYTDGWTFVVNQVEDKIIIGGIEGESYWLSTYEDNILYGSYDTNEYTFNKDLTIVDLGKMYGVTFYIYNNETLKHELILNSYDYEEIPDTEIGEYISIYHDNDYIYYQLKNDNWMRHSPTKGTKEVILDLDTEGMIEIKGQVRGA